MRPTSWKLTLAMSACAHLCAACAGELEPGVSASAAKQAGRTSSAGAGTNWGGNTANTANDAGKPPAAAPPSMARDNDAGASDTEPGPSAGRGGSSSPSNPAVSPMAQAGRAASTPVADGGVTPPSSGPSCDFRGLMQMKCGNASCHGGPTNSTGLDLTSAGLAMRVEGRKGAGGCEDELLVDAQDPERSVLYQRVVGTDCGVKMPLGASLTASEQACVLSWIEGL